MHTHTLHRDGQRALRFTGTLLASTQGARWYGKDQTRYYTLAIYQTRQGTVLVHWAYRTQWQGETPHDHVQAFPDIPSAVTALETFDPSRFVEGYRALLARQQGTSQTLEYAERQAVLERSIEEHYRAQVADICSTLDLVEDIS